MVRLMREIKVSTQHLSSTSFESRTSLALVFMKEDAILMINKVSNVVRAKVIFLIEVMKKKW